MPVRIKASLHPALWACSADTMSRAFLPFLTVLLPLVFTAPAAALDFSCRGFAPDWHLRLDADQALFRFPAQTEMQVMQETRAEGADWPRAYTLIGERDTAIVVIEQEICSASEPYRAHLLTQRGQTPLLLSGCCSATE